ncbi:probable 4-coumarate--CoA ligase 1 [Contarinia nasturtii]|uniref:probable 4-coumarate--CoA ligase 1 n=1 Tax=Contarinia nasturtii TaxID=265458 RepID=UPI0012D40FF5|nr:probable 4-coumarate--CoA ligase 1 [Contarinia nasturtii]
MYKTYFDKDTKLWKGRNSPPLYNPKISLARVVLRTCLNLGPKVAQISDDSGIQLTYDEIRLKTIRAAQNLQKRGYKSKNVVGIIAKNSHHLAPIVFASLAIGSAVNTLDTSFKKAELLHMLKTTKPVVIFCDVEVYDLVKECFAELKNDSKIFTFGGNKGDSEQVENLFEETHNEDDFVPVEVDGENDTAVIVCSSGTTGLPKGVCLSHAALLDGITQIDELSSTGVLLAFSSLYWISGWFILIGGMINGSTRIITTESFTPELHLQFIEKYRVTFILSVSHQMALLLKCDRIDHTDLSSLKLQMVGGAKCSFNIHREINAKLPNGKVVSGYGMSEASSAISMNLGDNDSVGQLLGSFIVKIVDENGNRCGIGENGEICFKTNYKFLGYFGNQKATDEVFDDEGFFLTGDIGHFDEDGNLYFIDRIKELIKYCNFQISPSQIETFLIELPDIKGACIIGIPGEVASNDLPAAYIVRNEASNITEKDIFNLVADHFADYCKLRGGVYFVDSLPVTPSGKIMRRKVKELAIVSNNIRK